MRIKLSVVHAGVRIPILVIRHAARNGVRQHDQHVARNVEIVTLILDIVMRGMRLRHPDVLAKTNLAKTNAVMLKQYRMRHGGKIKNDLTKSPLADHLTPASLKGSKSAQNNASIIKRVALSLPSIDKRHVGNGRTPPGLALPRQTDRSERGIMTDSILPTAQGIRMAAKASQHLVSQKIDFPLARVLQHANQAKNLQMVNHLGNKVGLAA